MSFIKDPRYNKGRWYRIFIESNGTDYVLHNNQIATEFSSNHLKLKDRFHVVTYGHDYTFTTTENAIPIDDGLYLYADGTVALNVAKANTFSSAYLFVFGYFE